MAVLAHARQIAHGHRVVSEENLDSVRRKHLAEPMDPVLKLSVQHAPSIIRPVWRIVQWQDSGFWCR